LTAILPVTKCDVVFANHFTILSNLALASRQSTISVGKDGDSFQNVRASFRKVVVSFRKVAATFAKVALPFAKVVVTFVKKMIFFAKVVLTFVKVVVTFGKVAATFAKVVAAFGKEVVTFAKEMAKIGSIFGCLGSNAGSGWKILGIEGKFFGEGRHGIRNGLRSAPVVAPVMRRLGSMGAWVAESLRFGRYFVGRVSRDFGPFRNAIWGIQRGFISVLKVRNFCF
jgi:hypothetical protein